MFETEGISAAEPQPATSRNAADIIVTAATEAFGSASLLWVLGGVALGIASSFAGDMIPSLPPGFAGEGSAQAHHAGHPSAWWHAVRGNAFVLFLAVFFVHSVWVGFRDGTGGGGRTHRILSNLREHWFGLIVGNAISAWVAVLILEIAQDFSPWQMLWHAVWALVLPLVGDIGRLFFGASASSGLSAWFSWYGANQMKLMFWIVFFGGAFDDLGVPNFKTLARWAWRKLQKRKALISPAPVGR